MAKVSVKKIREGLLAQLAAKGIDNDPVFNGLVEDYIACLRMEKLLQKDINDNGVRTEYESASGKVTVVANPSIVKLENSRKQRLAILKALNISPKEYSGNDDEEL